MKLIDLEPEFTTIAAENGKLVRRLDETDINVADGIMFLCPKCFQQNSGPVGTHMVLCWRPRVSQEITPGPGRWEFEGTGFNDLTLVAGSSSVLLQGGCQAHFFIRNGEIIMA